MSHQLSKQLEFRQKYSAARPIWISADEALSLVFILHLIVLNVPDYGSWLSKDLDEPWPFSCERGWGVGGGEDTSGNL